MILLTILTCIMYLLANGFTYYIGTDITSHCGAPLKDVLHMFLPDLSKWVHARDALLIFFVLPIIFIKNKVRFILEFWDRFMLIVAFKAICIFFTFLPPSNPDCSQKKYRNHCFHNAVSGHTAFTLLLTIMYTRYGICNNYIYIITALYFIFILMTRAHYTKDVLEAIIMTALIV
jgi:hypothetical protein